MPGDSAANRAAERYAELRRDEAGTPKKLYAVDGTVPPGAPVTDVAQLTAIAAAASRLFAAPIAWMSPVKCRLRSSIGTTCV